MDLQIALLVVGLLIIVLVVTVSLYDRARRRRAPRLEPAVEPAGSDHRSERGSASSLPGVVSRARPARVDMPPVTYTLDLNPAPEAVAELRALRADAPAPDPAPEAPASAEDDAVTSELRGLEDAAQVRLNLDAPPRPEERPSEPAAPDEKIDFVLTLPGEGPVARDTALGIFKQHEYRLEKRRRLYGRHYADTQWSDLARDPARMQYSDVALAIQLFDSRGPIDESELNIFSQVGLKLADALQRPTRLSLTFEEALKRAKELQVFSEAYDVIAGIHVLARAAAFRGRAIEQAAERAGLKFGARNIFHMKSDMSPGCRHLFSLANLFQPGSFDPQAWDTFETKGLALFMSVPCAHHPAAVFVKMATAARVLAEVLDGELCDQDRKPLDDKGLAIIRRQIEEIEARMTAYGVVPGSHAALRLFRESLIA